MPTVPHSPVEEHPGCFQLGKITNKSALNINLRVIVKTWLCVFLGCTHTERVEQPDFTAGVCLALFLIEIFIELIIGSHAVLGNNTERFCVSSPIFLQ